MNRKFAMAIIAASMLVGTAVTTYGAPIKLVYDGKVHLYDLPEISLFINGEKMETSVMNPVSIDDRILVPAREVFEPMGAQVDWRSSEKKVYIQYNGQEMILTVNEKEVLLDGESVYLDVPAKIINEKIMIPIRFISETMGFNVKWVGSEYAVYIDEKGNSLDQDVEITLPEEDANQEEVTVPSDEEPIFPEAVPEEEPIKTEITGAVQGNIYKGSSNLHQLNISSNTYDTATINEVSVEEENQQAVVTISAASALSGADISMQEGKVIIDINNSKSALQSKITPNMNTYVDLIRTSQFKSSTTRVVLDLKSGALVNASLSNDRTKLVLKLNKQSLEQIQLGRDERTDTVYFKGINARQMQISQTDDELQFTIANSGIGEAIYWTDLVNGSYLQISSVGNHVVGQMALSKACEYSLSSDLQGTTLTIKEKIPSQINYEGGSRPTLTLSEESGVRYENISVQDLYRERKLVIDLGDDCSKYFQTGTETIDDGKISTIQVTNEGTTKLIINTTSVYAVNMYDLGTGVQIELVKPSEKYDQIVVLDIGHGGHDNGAMGNNLKEKELNYKHAMAVYRLLEQDPNIKVYLTREDDVYPSLQFRTDLANDIGADLFVSIHNNSASASARGTETLYYPTSVSKQVAQLVQNKLIAYTNMINRGAKERKDLYVLRNSAMPAILIEGGFISNAEEAAYINSSSYIEAYGQAVYNGIVESFKILN